MDKSGLLKTDNKISKQIIKYSIIFAITTVAVYALFILLPRTFLTNTEGNIDGIAQTYPIYTEIKRKIAELLHGNGWSNWSWDIGLGDDSLMEFNTKLLNPLTYLVIIFPQKYLDIGFTFMVLVSQYLSGLFFILFGKKVQLSEMQNILGAISYAFSGWALYAISNQGTFLMATMLLPLLILGLEKIFKRESPVLFIVAVAMHIMYSIQWAYVGGVTILVYFVVRYLTVYKQEKISSYIFNFLGCGIVGIMTSGVVLVGTVSKMMGTTTTSSVDTPVFYTILEYINMPTSLMTLRQTSTPYSVICLSMLCVVLLPIGIRNIKKHSTSAIMTLCLAVLSIFPITGSIFNGFSYSVGRWFYVLVFFTIWMTMEALTDETFSNPKNIKIMGIWLGSLAVWGCVVCGIVIKSVSYWDLACIFVEAIIGCAIIFFAFKAFNSNQAKHSYIVVLLTIISIAGYFNFDMCPGFGENIHNLCQVGRIESDFSQSTQRVGVDVQNDDETFYRIDQVDGYSDTRIARVRANENMYFGNRSIYTYLSTMNSKWHELSKLVGNNAGYFDRTTVYSNDNREGLDFLMGVKYFLGDSDNKKEGANEYAPYGYSYYKTIDGVEVLRNNYNMGLATLYNQYITESEWMAYSPIEREQIMLQAIIVNDEDVDKVNGIHHATRKELQTDVKVFQIKMSGFEQGKFVVDKEHHDFTLNLPEIKNARVVVEFEGLVRDKNNYESNNRLKDRIDDDNAIARAIKSASYVDNEKFKIELSMGDVVKAAQMRKGKNQGYDDIKDYYINLGYYDEISGKVGVNIDRTGTYNCKAIKVYVVPMNIYNDATKELEKNKINIENYEDDTVLGTVKASENSIAYYSILNQNGWDVYIDDKKVDKIENGVNVAFTGVKLEKGIHKIELRYRSYGLVPGLILTIVGIALTILIDTVQRKRTTKQLQNVRGN